MGIGRLSEFQCPGQFFTAFPGDPPEGAAGNIGPSTGVFFEQPVDQKISLAGTGMPFGYKPDRQFDFNMMIHD
jgi:hypothetical protein